MIESMVSNDKYINLLNDNKPKGYEELYHQYYNPLCVYALRYVEDLKTAEDCVQDVFLRIWQDRDSLNLIVSIKSYLLTSVRNACLNWKGKQKYQMTYEQHILTTYDPISEDDLYTIDDLTHILDNAIRSFPDKERLVFKMSRFENLKNREIADKLNLSIKTIESYITKSLRHLKKVLTKYYLFLFFL